MFNLINGRTFKAREVQELLGGGWKVEGFSAARMWCLGGTSQATHLLRVLLYSALGRKKFASKAYRTTRIELIGVSGG